MTQLERFPASLTETWEPLAVLGEGAMGLVFRCRHREQGHEAALKVTRLPDDPRQAQRTLREAEVLARLEHPGVVRIFQGGRLPEGGVFLAMELLEGRSMDQGVAPHDPCELMLQIARALDVVHQEGLVHRDIKPANMLVTDTGRAVLLDFGLAFDADQTRLTGTGDLTGTMVYLAPDLLRGGAPTPASDWYSWGVSLYQLVEGELPYSWEEIQRHALTGNPLPEPAFPSLPPGAPLRALIRAALWPTPDLRIQSLEEVEAVLRATISGVPAPAPASPPPSPASLNPVPPGLLAPPAAVPAGETSLPVWVVPLLWFLVLLAGAQFALRAPEPPPPPPGPPEAPESAPRIPLGVRALRTTRVRAAVLRQVVRELTTRHPARDRLFCAFGHSAEIPPQVRAHTVLRIDRDVEGFNQDCQRLTSALRGWLVQTQDWAREEPEIEDPFALVELRSLLQEEVLPLLFHLVEDYLVAWTWLNDPRTIVPSPMESSRLTRELETYLNNMESLHLLLEDWQPLPPALRPLQLFLPRSHSSPGHPPGPHLEAVGAILAHPADAQAYWLAAKALMHNIAYGPWIKGASWNERSQALDLVARTLDGPGNPLLPRERALLRGRLLVELGRLGRGGDHPDDLGPLEERYLACARSFLEDPGANDAVLYAALSEAVRLGLATNGVVYAHELLEELMPRSHPFVQQACEEVRKRQVAAGALPPEARAPPREVARWPLEGRRP